MKTLLTMPSHSWVKQNILEKTWGLYNVEKLCRSNNIKQVKQEINYV